MADGDFGRYLVAQRVVTDTQLTRAREIQRENPGLRVGEILMGLGHLSLFNLIKHLQAFRSNAKIGDLLVMEGIVTTEQLKEALIRQKESGQLLGRILVEMGACTIGQLTQVLAMQRTAARIAAPTGAA
jgi:hypothetical protein